MTIIDRYLLMLFIRTFSVCFFSFSGLFVVIHLFSNLDEMIGIKGTQGWNGVAWGFYAPRIAEIFDKSSSIWALLGAAFAVNLMQRRREMTAIESIGIRKTRIVRSILAMTGLIVLLGIANRELILPKVREQLIRTAQNWENQDQLAADVYHDLSSGIKIRGDELSLTKNRIINVDVQIPAGTEQPVSNIQAEVAMIHQGKEGQADGLWLYKVTHPASIDGLSSESKDGVTIYWPTDTNWLKKGECYVVCKYDAHQAAYGKSLLNYQSVSELMAELRKPRVWYGNRTQITLHSRLVQPLLDISLLLLGLPLIVRRAEKNLFLSAGLCFLVIAVFQLTIIGCQFLGEYSMIQPASLAAWLPVILYTPIAVVVYRSMDH